MNEVIAQSILGIEREITKREFLLRARRFWYTNPNRTKSNIGFTMRGFYIEGYKILKDIQKLQVIKGQLIKLR